MLPVPAAPPPLPEGVPDEIRRFVGCQLAELVLADGPVTWLPMPGFVQRVTGHRIVPHAKVRPNRDPGWADLHVGWGPIGLRMTLGVVDGRLAVRFGRWPDPLVLAMRSDIEGWVAQVNRWLAANRRRLLPATITVGRVGLRKEGVGPSGDAG